MNETVPRTSNRTLEFENGEAIGMSHRWHQGQYCTILTKAGIVGCGIYDLETPAEVGEIAVAFEVDVEPAHCDLARAGLLRSPSPRNAGPASP